MLSEEPNNNYVQYTKLLRIASKLASNSQNKHPQPLAEIKALLTYLAQLSTLESTLILESLKSTLISKSLTSKPYNTLILDVRAAKQNNLSSAKNP